MPSAPVSIAVALADKIDILVGFWAIDEKPTGSKDPFALRRAALGVIALILENDLRLPLTPLFARALVLHINSPRAAPSDINLGDRKSSLLAFFADRLKVYLRERGARHDLIDAVFALPDQDDLLLIVRRVEALGAFLDTEDGANLLAGYRRAANILRAEEKKEGDGAFEASVDHSLLREPAEVLLWEKIESLDIDVRRHLELAQARIGRPEFAGQTPFVDAMSDLSSLRAPVDLFFEKVTVNAPEPELRLNRLRLLARLRRAVNEVADLSRVAG